MPWSAQRPQNSCAETKLDSSIMDERGRPFRYNQRKTLLNGSFIAAGAEPGVWQAICASLPDDTQK